MRLLYLSVIHLAIESGAISDTPYAITAPGDRPRSAILWLSKSEQ